jgi:uncharacterized membrane protein
MYVLAAYVYRGKESTTSKVISMSCSIFDNTKVKTFELHLLFI